MSAQALPTTKRVTLAPRLIVDSRGRPTVAVTAHLGEVHADGDVPAGASKGRDEAKTVTPQAALQHLAGPLTQLLHADEFVLTDAAALCAFDRKMASVAGDNFATLGANATLPLSRALWQLGAKLRQKPLYAFLREGLEAPPATFEAVLMMMNIFNGGLHAVRPGETLGRERIDLQEIMVVPVRTKSYAQALAMGDAIDAALEQILHEAFGADAVGRADEAGFSVRGLGDSDRAIALVQQAITKAGFEPGVDCKLALDCAAQSFVDEKHQAYRFGGTLRSSAQMVAWHHALVQRYPNQLLSIEDGLGEDDWAGWSQLTKTLTDQKVVTVGDDLFVTQLPRLRRGIAAHAASAILIKVNQNGTIGGTLEVIDEAHRAGLRCIVSHRSGETLDDSIADLAVACGALGLKSGDPQPPHAFPDANSWHRRAKYARLVAIEAEAAKR